MLTLFSRVKNYLADFMYGSTKFRWGLVSPRVVKGYFAQTENGAAQKQLFDALQDVGFKRTPFQLVMPGQTAGLVRKVGSSSDGINEQHVRFYEDGAIDIELEYDRFSENHWREFDHDVSELETILADEIPTSELSDSEKDVIRMLFEERDYSRFCKRAESVGEFVEDFSYNGTVSKFLAHGSLVLMVASTIDFAYAYLNGGSMLGSAFEAVKELPTYTVPALLYCAGIASMRLWKLTTYGTTSNAEVAARDVFLDIAHRRYNEEENSTFYAAAKGNF